jgi:hypothetical protein
MVAVEQVDPGQEAGEAHPGPAGHVPPERPLLVVAGAVEGDDDELRRPLPRPQRDRLDRGNRGGERTRWPRFMVRGSAGDDHGGEGEYQRAGEHDIAAHAHLPATGDRRPATGDRRPATAT